MHVRANFQSQVWNVDTLVYCRKVCFLAVPAYRDETGIVIHAVFNKAVLTIEDSVALLANVELSFPVVSEKRSSPLHKLFD